MSKALRKSKKNCDSGSVRVFCVKHDILDQSYVLTYKATFYITCLVRIDNFGQDFFDSFCDYFGKYFIVYIQ